MIVYQLRFQSLPRFEKYFMTQDELFSYLDTAPPQAGKPIVKVRDIPVKRS
jgi:hypothetical protein